MQTHLLPVFAANGKKRAVATIGLFIIGSLKYLLDLSELRPQQRARLLFIHHHWLRGWNIYHIISRNATYFHLFIHAESVGPFLLVALHMGVTAR